MASVLSYQRSWKTLSYWRSTHGYEVDFIIGDEVAIEVKTSQNVSTQDGKSRRALQEEGQLKRFYLVSQDPIEAVDNGLHRLHWQTFLHRLWQQTL